MRTQNDGFGWVEIVLVLAAVLLISGGGYLYYRHSGQVDQTKPKAPVAQNQDEIINSVPTAAAAVANTSDLDKATQSINELNIDSNNTQTQQLDTDTQQN